MIDTKTNLKEYVFLAAQVIEGISQKSQKAYKLNKISFADPLTYENHQLDFKDGLNLSYLNKGDRVHLVTEFVPGFGNADSRSLVISIIPVK